jgi:hypothetical protein
VASSTVRTKALFICSFIIFYSCLILNLNLNLNLSYNFIIFYIESFIESFIPSFNIDLYRFILIN